MRKALIFGANLGSSGLIRFLQREGYHCTALGHDGNQMGALVADTFYRIDYNDPNSIPTSIRRISFDAIVPGAHDLCYKAYCAFVDCESGPVIAPTSSGLLHQFEALHNKGKFRARLLSICPSRCPRFYIVNGRLTAVEEDLFPALFKPNHAGGGRGIIRMENVSSFLEFQKTTPVLNGVLEKIVNGVDISISMWMEGGKLATWYADREFSQLRAFMITGSLSNNKFLRHIEELGVLSELSEVLVKLGCSEGFTHCQIRLCAPGEWILVEITRRLPGDLYPLVPEYFGGMPYTKNYVETFLGIRPVSYKGFQFRKEGDFGRSLINNRTSPLERFVTLSTFRSHRNCVNDSYELSLLCSDSASDLFSSEIKILGDSDGYN